jgi:hypothetical protein
VLIPTVLAASNQFQQFLQLQVKSNSFSSFKSVPTVLAAFRQIQQFFDIPNNFIVKLVLIHHEKI